MLCSHFVEYQHPPVLAGPEAAGYDAHQLTSLQREIGELEPVMEALQTLTDVKVCQRLQQAAYYLTRPCYQLATVPLVFQHMLPRTGWACGGRGCIERSWLRR